MPITSNTEFQKSLSSSFTAAGQTFEVITSNSGTTSFQVTGTWSGTIVIEATIDEINYTTLSIFNVSGSNFLTSIVSNGIFLIPTNSYKTVRARASAFSSGTANLFSNGSDSTSVIFADLAQGKLVPTITNKLRIRKNIGDINLPGGGGFITLFSRSGSGLFFGFQAGFDGATVNIKLTIDSGEVFTLNLDDVRQFQFNDTTTTRTQSGAFLTTIGNVFDFSSRFAIPYTTSITIEAESSTGAAKKNKNWISILTEDT